MDEPLAEKIRVYAQARQLRIGRKLGAGNEGTVWAARGLTDANEIAVKFHRAEEGYAREKLVYERLREKRVIQILGFKRARRD